MVTQSRPFIIGGMFGLEELPVKQYSPAPFLTGNSVLMANARSGIAFLIERLSPAHVWMPSYFCDHVLKIVKERAAAIRYYEVNACLAIPSSAWVDDVRENDLVVMVDYFGFPCDSGIKKQVKERGARLLEDASQALLSEGVGGYSDFVLFSPRKFLGVPDGGVLVIRQGSLPETVSLQDSPIEWWQKSLIASVLRSEFDRHGGSRRWFELFREAEVQAPVGAYAMSDVSGMLLRHGFDFVKIAGQRVKNYTALAHELGDYALFPIVPPDVVPVGFPVRVADRDRIRQKFFNHAIYPPVHWPIQGVVPDEYRDSHVLSSEIMTIPCDQRYREQDMDRIITVFMEEGR